MAKVATSPGMGRKEKPWMWQALEPGKNFLATLIDNIDVALLHLQGLHPIWK
jgi:hypothetical protein